MKKVIFYKLADRQLDDIFDCSYNNFGFDRACSYINGLESALEETVRTKKYKGKHWQKIPQESIGDLTNKPVYFIRYERHIVFFRDLSNRIGVISILSDRQDLPSRIREVLDC